MEFLSDFSLHSFLDLAVRHEVIEGFDFDAARVTIFIGNERHLLDHHQAWSFLSVSMYDRWRDDTLGVGWEAGEADRP
jgi:hypothetical protein